MSVSVPKIDHTVHVRPFASRIVYREAPTLPPEPEVVPAEATSIDVLVLRAQEALEASWSDPKALAALGRLVGTLRPMIAGDAGRVLGVTASAIRRRVNELGGEP